MRRSVSPRSSCVRLDRRVFLTAGSVLGLCGVNARRMDGGETAGSGSFGRARRCIILFLTGGPPQHDTWDPKPLAPASIRGETTTIETSVPGIRFGHLFPKLASSAGRFCLLRSVTHSDTVHTSAGYTLLTGVPHPAPNNPMGAKTVGPAPEDHPHVGSILASAHEPPAGLPVFASLPEVIKDAAINEFPGQTAGFLGRRFDPLRIEYDANIGRLQLPDLLPPAHLPAQRAERRLDLLRQLDDWTRGLESSPRVRAFDMFRHRALSLSSSRRLHDALDFDAESPRTRDRYGSHLFGRGCLLARRLIEAGVPLVNVYWHYEGPDDSPVWDTHWNNFPHLRERLAPPCDQAVSALVEDLAMRGLLADTLVVVMGEFGRTPVINNRGGRDHWPHVQTALLAGAGVPGGTVYGASDGDGAYPAEAPVSPADLTATILHLLGVPPDLELTDLSGRALKACTGSPIAIAAG